MKVSVEKERQLYIIEDNSSYSCLGFNYVMEQTKKLAQELNSPSLLPIDSEYGTVEAYYKYLKLVAKAKEKFERSNWQSKSGLTPQLIGLEGRRVEVVDSYGERRRFQVGKSTGYIPCHIELKRVDSSGGGAVSGAPFKELRIIK